MGAFDKKNEGPVSVTFAVPSFRHKGVEYNSAEVMKAAEAGNEEAQVLIATLVSIGSGVLNVSEAEAPAEAAEEVAEAKPVKKKKGGNHE